MNIMLACVSERTKEIGIRQAVGATPKNIIEQFLCEAIIITLIGAVIGVILGGTASVLVASLANWEVVITLWSIIVPILMSLVVGIFSGIYPALKASATDPIYALRYE